MSGPNFTSLVFVDGRIETVQCPGCKTKRNLDLPASIENFVDQLKGFEKAHKDCG